jgi:hypothetical protein
MEIVAAPRALPKLGHPGRRAGGRLPMRPTGFAPAVGLKPSTRAHRRADLTTDRPWTRHPQNRSRFCAIDRNPSAALRARRVFAHQAPGAPALDIVRSVSDEAAAAACPPRPVRPITGHAGLPDPVRATGGAAERALALERTSCAGQRQIEAAVALPMAHLNPLQRQARIAAINAAAQAQA